MTYNKENKNLIPAHGGYRNLRSYQNAEIVYDYTVVFTENYINKFSRTKDQMDQAARSGKQNIAEGSMASGTSKKTELKLINVARASLEELLLDYEDFLRQHGLEKWHMNNPRTKEVRDLAYKSHRSYEIYKSYMTDPESAANVAICLINQTNYLLDQLKRKLEKDFLENGGFTERLYDARKNYKSNKTYETNRTYKKYDL